MKSLISSVRIELAGNHAHIGVWSRGGKAGTLVVDKDDAFYVAKRLSIDDGGTPIYFNSWKWELSQYQTHSEWYGVSDQFPKWTLKVGDMSAFWVAYLEGESSETSKVMHGPYYDEINDVTWSDCFIQAVEYVESTKV